ncbi:MAG TPA: chemotaxis protein CheW [Bryobacteraceae bacterium]|nr:chemotaxis protein CheW [Bryobacteraceae bacterium]
MTQSGKEGAAPAGITGKYLVFRLASEEYGVNVKNVREILGRQIVTAVPQSPPQVKGVMNLRGKIVPVVDLRSHCGLEADSANEQPCVIVLEVVRGNDLTLTGALVDSVCEVISLNASDVETPPEFGEANLGHILGLAKWKGRVQILLDIDQLFADWQPVSMQAVLNHAGRVHG